jgi:hypothetical protein
MKWKGAQLLMYMIIENKFCSFNHAIIEPFYVCACVINDKSLKVSLLIVRKYGEFFDLNVVTLG